MLMASATVRMRSSQSRELAENSRAPPASLPRCTRNTRALSPGPSPCTCLPGGVASDCPTSVTRPPPDWICEVLSRSTEQGDRAEKLPVYAREGVRFACLVNPLVRLLEVLRLESGKWLTLAVYRDEARFRAEPFDAVELELGVLWSDVKIDVR